MKIKVLHIEPIFTKDDIQFAEAEVGILNNGIMGRKPVKGSVKNFAGGSAMKTGGIAGISVAEVAEINDQKYGWFDYTITHDDKPLIDVTAAMAQMICKSDDRSIRRYKNALTAWLRNPITTRKFGMNSPRYVRWKGFDWVMVCTGQMFNTIKARLISEK